MKLYLKILSIILVISILIYSCIPPNHLFWTKYTVLKETHYSIPRVNIVVPSQVVALEFKTNGTWDWDTSIVTGWSKITGVMWGSVHDRSIRVVYNGTYLGWYIYLHGVSPMENNNQWGNLWLIDKNTTYTASIGYRHGGLYLHIYNNEDDTQDTTIMYECSKSNYIPVLAAPYIGGTYTLPHNWEVPIKLK